MSKSSLSSQTQATTPIENVTKKQNVNLQTINTYYYNLWHITIGFYKKL